MTDAETGRLRTRLGWAAAFTVLALLVAKAFLVDVYRVTSTSMEPTLFGASGREEHVLVLYDTSAPERWEMVVLKRPGEPDALVKRVVGLPGERVQLAGGDLLVDGARPRGGRRPAPIVVLDAARQDLAPLLHAGPEGRRWSCADGELLLAATAEEEASTFLVPEIADDYLAPDGRLVRGEHEVNDLAVETELQLEPGARARIGLTEQGDLFWLELERHADGRGLELRLARADAEAPAAPPVVLASAALEDAGGGSHRVGLANVDDELSASLDGVRMLAHPYHGNRFDPADTFFEGKTYRARLWLGASGAPARLRGLRLARDLYFTPRGTHATGEPEPLGPGRLFVLGDNSALSQDSREWGPVPAAEIVGRPLCVVWPPSRWRWTRSSGAGGVEPARE